MRSVGHTLGRASKSGEYLLWALFCCFTWAWGSAGCRTCFTPYDSCSPLVTCPGAVCDPLARAGSVLAGSESWPSTSPAISDNTDAVYELEDFTARQQVPGIRILSITDRKLEDFLQKDGPNSDAQPQLLARPEPTGSKDGWTTLR